MQSNHSILKQRTAFEEAIKFILIPMLFQKMMYLL